MPTHRPRSPINRSRASSHSNTNNTKPKQAAQTNVTSNYSAKETFPTRGAILNDLLAMSAEGSAQVVDWFNHEYYVDLERLRSNIPYFVAQEKDFAQDLKDRENVRLGLTPGSMKGASGDLHANADPFWIFDMMNSEPKSGLLGPAATPVITASPSLSAAEATKALSSLSLNDATTPAQHSEGHADTLVVPLDFASHSSLERIHGSAGMDRSPDVHAMSTLIAPLSDLPDTASAESHCDFEAVALDLPNMADVISPVSPDTVIPNVKMSKPKGLLYLGGWKMSYGKWPRKHKIKLIVNCARIPDIMAAGSEERMNEWVKDSEALEKDGCKFHRIPWFDIDKQRLWDKTPWDQIISAVLAIHSALSQGKNVLVHCRKGRSRSATVVLCYLMARHGFSKMEALNFLKDKRPSVNPNQGFSLQLVEFMRTGSNGALKYLRERVGLDSLPEREAYLKAKQHKHDKHDKKEKKDKKEKVDSECVENEQKESESLIISIEAVDQAQPC